MNMTKLVIVETADKGPMAIAHNLVALVVPALDEKTSEPIVGHYAALPTRDVLKGSLAELAGLFGLVIFDGAKGDRFAVAPGAVGRVHNEVGMIGCSIIELGVPGVVPRVPVKCTVEDATRRLNEADSAEPAAPSLLAL